VGTIHIMIKQSEKIHKRVFATEAGVLQSSIASVAASQKNVSISGDEAKRDGGSSSGEWDEEDGEEESDSQVRDDSK